jgi:polyisoprenoid-binding protein YceI
VLNEQNPEASTVTAQIDVTSIDTRQEQRDAHLRSADFFDVEQFPSIRFTSTRIVRDGGHFDVHGQLTIRDVTRDVVLRTTDEGRAGDPWGGRRAAFSASTKVDRRDFGLTYNQVLETGGVMVGNEIKISLEVQAVQA